MSKKASQAAAVVGAPGTFTIGEHVFLVSKPSARDLLFFQKWVMAQPLEESAQGICSKELDGLRPEERLLMIKSYAQAKAAKRDPSQAEIVQIVYSPAGVAMQLWCAARRHHPGLKLEEVKALVTEDNCDQVAADLDDATSDKKPDGSEGDDPKKLDGQASSPASSPEISPSPS